MALKIASLNTDIKKVESADVQLS